jgi:hypothetical protein
MPEDLECVVCGKRTSDGPFCEECGRRERPAFMRVVGVSAALSWAVFLTGLLGLTAWHWHPLPGLALTAAGATGLYESLKLFRKRRKWFK